LTLPFFLAIIEHRIICHRSCHAAKSFGMDLISLDLQRGRDHGLPPYVAWREACRLTPIRNWGQLLTIMDEDTVGRLRIAYG